MHKSSSRFYRPPPLTELEQCELRVVHYYDQWQDQRKAQWWWMTRGCLIALTIGTAFGFVIGFTIPTCVR